MKSVAVHQEVKEVIPASDTEALILSKLSTEPVHVDEICRETSLPIATLTSALSMMELKGMVKQVSGMNYVLSRKVREELGSI